MAPDRRRRLAFPASYVRPTRPVHVRPRSHSVGFAGLQAFGKSPEEKVGDEYLAARSNEFGYANYEVIAKQAEMSPLAAGAKPLR